MKKILLVFLVCLLFINIPAKIRAGDSLGYFYQELDYLLADNDYSLDSAQKIFFINSACRLVVSLVSHYADCVVDTTTISIQSDTILYNLPANFYAILSARQYQGERPAMEYVPAWDWSKDYTTTGYVSKLSIIGRFLEVSPKPTNDDGILIFYNARPNQLDSLDDTTLIPWYYSEVIPHFAKGYCMKRQERYAEAQADFDFGWAMLNSIVSGLSNQTYTEIRKPKIIEEK